MKKIQDKYIKVWLILFLLFNALSIVVALLTTGIHARGGMFLTGFGAVDISFIVQLVLVLRAYEGETQRYYREKPLIRTSYLGLLLTAVLGTVSVLLLPGWVSVLLGMALLVYELMAFLNSGASGMKEAVKKEAPEEAFLPALTQKAEKLLADAPSEAVKAAAEKVLAAIKKANPAQSPALASVEAKIAAAFAELEASDEAGAPAAAEKVLSLLRDRNNSCKLLK